MKKQIHLEEQLVVRVSRPLRAELEAAAAEDGRELSSLIRRVLISYATPRVIDREAKL